MKSLITSVALAAFLATSAASVQAKPADAGKGAVQKKAPKTFSSPQKEGTKATCPISNEEFTIAKDTEHSEYKGKYVYFCCPGCKGSFDKNPEAYLK